MFHHLLFLLGFGFLSLWNAPVMAQKQGEEMTAALAPTDTVMHIIIDGEIDPGMAAYLKRGVDRAKDQGAAALIVELNTPGGRLDAALVMKDILLDAEEDNMRIITFVKRHAYSAGALIALAAAEIYMMEGGVIGAATPVDGEGHKLDEKTVSATRVVFAATAERFGRDAEIAKAMVDDSVAIEGVSDAGKLLTLSAQQATDLDFVNGQVTSLDTLLDITGLGAMKVIIFSPSLAEEAVRFITRPMVASLLLSLAMIALFAEFKAPGMGYGGMIAILCYALFFWGHHLAGLAGWEDIALVITGIVFLAIEIFVLPGFGIFGLLGMAGILGGFYISLIGNIDSTPQVILMEMSVVVSVALIGAVILIFGLYRIMFRGKGFDSGIILSGSLESSNDGIQKQSFHALHVGEIGVAQSDLRPAGSAVFQGMKVSVSSDGDFIDAGSSLEIIQISGSNITVRIKH